MIFLLLQLTKHPGTGDQIPAGMVYEGTKQNFIFSCGLIEILVAPIHLTMAPSEKTVLYHPVYGYAVKPTQELKTIKRNARERRRVQSVNRSYELLKQHLPNMAHKSRVSKVKIVHQAIEYMKLLQKPSMTKL